jgi:hypothetical protein
MKVRVELSEKDRAELTDLYSFIAVRREPLTPRAV